MHGANTGSTARQDLAARRTYSGGALRCPYSRWTLPYRRRTGKLFCAYDSWGCSYRKPKLYPPIKNFRTAARRRRRQARKMRRERNSRFSARRIRSWGGCNCWSSCRLRNRRCRGACSRRNTCCQQRPPPLRRLPPSRSVQSRICRRPETTAMLPLVKYLLTNSAV